MTEKLYDLRRYFAYGCAMIALALLYWLSSDPGASESVKPAEQSARPVFAPAAPPIEVAAPGLTETSAQSTQSAGSAKTEGMTAASWAKEREQFSAARSFRVLIHDALRAPTQENVAFALRAATRCVDHAMWQGVGASKIALNDTLAVEMERLKQRCSDPIKDMLPALQMTAKKVGLNSMNGHHWAFTDLSDAGLAELVRLGDGDLIAEFGTQFTVRLAALAPEFAGAPSAVLAGAWIIESCRALTCDERYMQLRLCMLMNFCRGDTLEAQMEAALLSMADKKVLAEARAHARDMIAGRHP